MFDKVARDGPSLDFSRVFLVLPASSKFVHRLAPPTSKHRQQVSELIVLEGVTRLFHFCQQVLHLQLATLFELFHVSILLWKLSLSVAEDLNDSAFLYNLQHDQVDRQDDRLDHCDDELVGETVKYHQKSEDTYYDQQQINCK